MPDHHAATTPVDNRPFRERKTLAARIEEVQGIRSKFPNKVPVIVERYHKEKALPQLDKTKFLVPQELTMSQFVTIIRNRMALTPTQAFYLLIDDKGIASMSMTLAEIYEKKKANDGFLYMSYASQVADEDGCIKFFKTHKKLNLIKEFKATKSCIYDLEWLSAHQLACGGGDHTVLVYDASTQQRVSLLRGAHTESVKAIASASSNVLASGARDGSVFVYDLRCNRSIDGAVRAMHSIVRAHYVETSGGTPSAGRAVLKSKTSNTSGAVAATAPSHQLQQHHHVKPSPVACLAFQNEFSLVSAGATDGYIKVWDIRKLWTSTNNWPHPVHSFDDALTPLNRRGYSSLAFDSTRSHAYLNYMNSLICEHNMLTYSQHHTRAINTRTSMGPAATTTYNTNSSTFIKSSVSPCGQFLLTGSSDSNAYIFATGANRSMSATFRRAMSPIVLRAHMSEVTTVDWNPFDLGQCVTCSDDNTIRVWTVQRDIDDAEMGEFNFFKADVIIDDSEEKDELDLSKASTGEVSLLNDSSLLNERKSQVSDKRENNYISALRTNQRIYGPCTGSSDKIITTNIYDDMLFRSYECLGPLGRYSRPNRIVDLAEIDLVTDKCESIRLLENRDSTLSISERQISTIDLPFKRFVSNQSLLSNLPINLINDNESQIQITAQQPSKKQVQTLTNTLFSFLKTPCSGVAEPKSLKPVINKRKKVEPVEPNEQHAILSTITTSNRKRAPLNTFIEDVSVTSQQRCAKRRLVDNDDVVQRATSTTASPKTPNSRTILHYFTPKSSTLLH